MSSKYSGSTEKILVFSNLALIAVLIPAINPPPPQQHKTISGVTLISSNCSIHSMPAVP